jgi:hypothetical protein
MTRDIEVFMWSIGTLRDTRSARRSRSHTFSKHSSLQARRRSARGRDTILRRDW